MIISTPSPRPRRIGCNLFHFGDNSNVGALESAPDRLQSAPAESAAKQEAECALRSLIDRIVVRPNPSGRGVTMEVGGRLAGLIALATGREPPESLTAKVERVKGFEPCA